MASWQTAAVLWLVAGLSSAVVVPFMTDQLLLAVFAIGAVVGIVLAVASLLRRSNHLAAGTSVSLQVADSAWSHAKARSAEMRSVVERSRPSFAS